MNSNQRTIGRLAAECNVHVETVRFYQRKGLIATPERNSGFRVYSDADVARIRFIRSARGLGFSLDEIHHLLQLREEGARACSSAMEHGRRKLGELREKIAGLQRMESALNDLLQSCETNSDGDCCPLLEAIEDPLPVLDGPPDSLLQLAGHAKDDSSRGGCC